MATLKRRCWRGVLLMRGGGVYLLFAPTQVGRRAGPRRRALSVPVALRCSGADATAGFRERVRDAERHEVSCLGGPGHPRRALFRVARGAPGGPSDADGARRARRRDGVEG